MKITERFGNFVASLLVYGILTLFVPFLLLCVLVMFLYVPIDYLKFKRSRYQKDFPCKYSLWCGKHDDNAVYTLVKEQGLPIAYIKIHNGNDYALRGCFLYKDILLDFSEPFFFDKKRDCGCFGRRIKRILRKPRKKSLIPTRKKTPTIAWRLKKQKTIF